MTVFNCTNCRFRFQSESATKCPRCDSQDITEFTQGKRQETRANPSASGTPGAPTQPPRVIREGKEGWQDFHSQQAAACPECGGTEFDLNWKRKEKTCKKCGAVMALPRRFS